MARISSFSLPLSLSLSLSLSVFLSYFFWPFRRRRADAVLTWLRMNKPSSFAIAGDTNLARRETVALRCPSGLSSTLFEAVSQLPEPVGVERPGGEKAGEGFPCHEWCAISK